MEHTPVCVYISNLINILCVQSKPQALTMLTASVILNVPPYTRLAWSRVFTKRRVENTSDFFYQIWSKYAMDGFIACTNICLRDLDGGR